MTTVGHQDLLKQAVDACLLSKTSHNEVNDMLDDVMNASGNGFWDVSTTDLRTISADIASRFDFTVIQVTN